MNKYMVLTVTKQSKTLHSAIFVSLDTKKRVHLRGNLPDLYTNMTIGLCVDGINVTDYELELTEKNIACLNRYGIDVEKYRRTLRAHLRLKEKGVTWYVASLDNTSEDENVYDALPFPEADKVHKEMINNPTDAKRLRALNKETLEIARNTHRKIAYKVDEFLGYFSEAEREGAYQQLMIAMKVLCLKAQDYSFRDGRVWDNEMKRKEDYIFANIRERIETEYNLCTPYEIEQFTRQLREEGYLCEEQIATLGSLDSSAPCIITGGAGVGKTSVIKAIIDCYAKYYGRQHILLVAPTGKASRRLAEKTGLSAMTIHRALRKVPDDSFVFYDEENRLPHRLVIVDESSMIDTALMYDLLCAVNPTSKIIFVGDHNQLYPVGYGEPFFQFLSILEEKKGVFRLNENHRADEGTDILQTATDVLEDRPVQSGRGVIVREIEFNEMQYIFDKDDQNSQIIAPRNDLCREINLFLRKGEDIMNVGDKVIALKNTELYCNGDIGYIVKKDDRKGSITVDFEGRIVEVTKAHRDDIDLAYAITVHKMQGSEAERIQVFIKKGDTFVDKRMLYTAVTRARKQLEIYYYH